jgi:hypothetical protein
MRVLLLAGILSALSGHAFAADSWLLFKDPDSAFTVELPGTPTVSTSSTKAGDGSPIPILTYEVSGSPDVAIVIGDFTKLQYDIGKVIDGCISGIKEDAVTVELDQLSVLDGQVGHEIVVVDKDGSRLDDRVYFVQGRLYQVLAGTTKGTTADQLAQGQQFLASFHFTPK